MSSGERMAEGGLIGCFNLSYYEEVVIVRDHPEFLERQKLPPKLVKKDIWENRFKEIRDFERHLANNGTRVLKFFLHISPQEQRKRLLARLQQPEKRWKFSMDDVAERRLWDKYMVAYEEAIAATSRAHAPWYVVPADSKPFARLIVAAALIEALEDLDLHYPKIEGAALKELEKVEAALISEKSPGKSNPGKSNAQ